MTTSQHSTQHDSEDELISYPLASHASLIHSVVQGLLLEMSVTSGERSREFWGKRNQDGFWEKMCQDSLALNLETSSVGSSMTWPKWGIALDGVVMELRMSAQSTGAKESSSLLGTPTVNDSKNSMTESQRGRRTLTADLIPTPTTQCAKGGSSGTATHGAPSLNGYFLPTPRAGKTTSESQESWEKRRAEGKVSTPPLALAVQMLPTPQAFDSKDFKKGDLTDKTTKNGKKGGRSNLREVDFEKMMLPTPTSSQNHKPVRQLIPSEIKGTHGTTLVGAIGDQCGVATGAGGVLNPYFVQEMMGFPPGWLV